MKRLSANELGPLTPEHKKYSYDRNNVNCGIVHFGVGNFHRAHQAVYCDDLLNLGETEWGITGVSMRSSSVYDALAPQDFLYTEATLGNKTNYRIIGSLLNIIVAPDDPDSVTSAVARANTHVVTTTITEKGYCLSSNQVNQKTSDFVDDKTSLREPKTIYGYLAAALIKRRVRNALPITVVCCDNIQNGGAHLKVGVLSLLQTHCQDTLKWAADNISFVSSMVDRVCPTTSDSLRHQVAQDIKLSDAWPVSAEPFSQWVIEDKFAGKRPPLNRVGAIFVDDVKPYEQLKLRFLNAGHSMVAMLGYLSGDQCVHEALLRPSILNFLRKALHENILPVADIPEGADGEIYIEDVITRFQNSNLPYASLQVGSDSSQKIQQRWLPTIDDTLVKGGDSQYLSFSLAVWFAFTYKAIANNDLNDPQVAALNDAIAGANTGIAKSLLSVAGVENFQFFNDADFMQTVEDNYREICQKGIENALAEFLKTNIQV